jgi:hypothetical protein
MTEVAGELPRAVIAVVGPPSLPKWRIADRRDLAAADPPCHDLLQALDASLPPISAIPSGRKWAAQ